MDQLGAQYVQMAGGHHSQLHNPTTTVNFVQQLQAVVERSSAPRKNFLIDTTTPHGDAVITEASAMKPGIGWITLQVTEGIRKGVHEWCVKIENQGETTDGSGLMLGLVPKSFTKFDSFISQGGGWCLSRAGKFYGHWRRHESSPSTTITFGTGDRVVFTLDYDTARMTVRVGDKQIVGEVSNLTTEVYPAISLHYRHQHVRFEYHVTHDRSAKQRDWMERGVLPTAAYLLPLSPAELERLPLDSYLFSGAFASSPPTFRSSSRRSRNAMPPGADDGSTDPSECLDSLPAEDGYVHGSSGEESNSSSNSNSEDDDDAAGVAEVVPRSEAASVTRRSRRRLATAKNLPYASLEAFTARLTVLLNALATVRRYTGVSPLSRSAFLSPTVTAEYLRKRFYESLHGNSRGSASPAAGAGALYDATLNCGAVIVIHMFAKVAGTGGSPMALPLVQSLTDYLLSLPLFSLAETNSSLGAGGAWGAGGSLSPEVVQLAVGNIFSIVEASSLGATTTTTTATPTAAPSPQASAPAPAAASPATPPTPLCGALMELATLLALQRGVVHEVLRACRALLRCPHGVVSRPFEEWLRRNGNALRPRRELPDVAKGLRIACEDIDHFLPTAISPASVKTQVLAVAYGGDSEGSCSIYVHSADGLSRWVEQPGRYRQAQHTRKPDTCCTGATKSSMAVTMTHVLLLTDRMCAEGVAVVVYTTTLELHRTFALSEMGTSWPREVRANAQLTSGPEDQILLVYECHDQPAVHVANGAAAASVTSSAVLSAAGSIARAVTRGKAAGVQAQGFLLPTFPRPLWTITLKAPSPSVDFSLAHCLALRKPCVVDLGLPDAYLQLPAGHVTVEMWLTLLDKEDATTLYQHGDKGTTGEVFLETTRLEGAHCVRGGYRHDARGSCVVSAPLPPTAETRFFHIALVFDGRWHLFFDGEEVACNRQGPHVSLDAPKQRWTACNNCTCLLAGLRVWMLGRSAREVARDCKRMLAGDEPGLACQMLFNEYSGNVVFNYVASTRSRHAVCSGTFAHVACDNHPWRSFGTGGVNHLSPDGGAGASSQAAAAGPSAGADDDSSRTMGPSPSSSSSPSHGEIVPPRSAIHEWADLSLSRCFCCQGQLVLATQVTDAAPYALPSGRVLVFFDLQSGAASSAFFYLTAKSPAQGYMGLDTTGGRIYELFDLDAESVTATSASDALSGGTASEERVICLAHVPLERENASGLGAAGLPNASASGSPVLSIAGAPATAALGTGSSSSSANPDLPPLCPGDAAATTSAFPSFSSPSAGTATATTAGTSSSAKLSYGGLSTWLLQLLSQYAAEEPAQEMAQLFSPLADDVGRRCSAEVQATLQEHFRVVKGPSARRVVTLSSPASREVIACTLRILLRLIRRTRAFGLHPASIGLNVFGDGPSSTEDVNRLLRELSVFSSRRRSSNSSSNSPLSSSHTLLPTVGQQHQHQHQQQQQSTSAEKAGAAVPREGEVTAASSSSSGGGGGAGTLVGLLGDVLNEAGKTLPLNLGTLARTVIVEGMDLFVPQVRDRAKLLREVLDAASLPAHGNSTPAAAATDRVPALDALVDGIVESLSTVLATAPLLSSEEAADGPSSLRVTVRHPLPPQQPTHDNEGAVNVLTIADEDGECAALLDGADSERRRREEKPIQGPRGGHRDERSDPLRETRYTLRVLIEESVAQLRGHFGDHGRAPQTTTHGKASPVDGVQGAVPGPGQHRPAPIKPPHRPTRVCGVRPTSLSDAISSLQLLLLSACQGLPAEHLMHSAATSQKVHNVFAVPRPCAEHRPCVRAYYGVVFKAAREGLGAVLRNGLSGVSADAAGDMAAIANSFLAVPLHTAITSIPLVMSIEDAPWFLRELEALLPICDATRGALRGAPAAGRARDDEEGASEKPQRPGDKHASGTAAGVVATAARRNSLLAVLFDAVLLSASWVATRMSRASMVAPPAAAGGDSVWLAGVSRTVDGALQSDVHSPVHTAQDTGTGVSGPGADSAEAEGVADSDLLAGGVDLSLLKAISAAAAADGQSGPALPQGGTSTTTHQARRAAVLGLLTATEKQKWMEVQKKLDPLGMRVTASVAETISLAAATCLYLSSEPHHHFAQAMPTTLRRLVSLRNALLERRAQRGSTEEFGEVLRDMNLRCCILLCAASQRACLSVESEEAFPCFPSASRRTTTTTTATPSSTPLRRLSARERWQRAIVSVRCALRTRHVNVLLNHELDLAHAITLVSRCVQSTSLTSDALLRVFASREHLAAVRLQGLEQLLKLMRDEPSCTESVAQLLSTTEEADATGWASPATASDGAVADGPETLRSRRLPKASHFELGINGCTEATRNGLRVAMRAMLEWLMVYQRVQHVPESHKEEGEDGDVIRDYGEAANRLPYLCAFLRRTWMPRDLTVLLRLRLVKSLFTAHCTLFRPVRRSRPTDGTSSSLLVLRVPSTMEDEHRAKVLAYQRRLAGTRGAGAGAGATADGVAPSSSPLATDDTRLPLTGAGAAEEVADLNVTPTMYEFSKRVTLDCLKQLGLQCASMLSSDANGEGPRLTFTARQAASNFLENLVEVIERELRLCHQLSTKRTDSEVVPSSCFRDQVQALCSLLATVFRALDPKVAFHGRLDRTVSECAKTVYCVVANDVLILPVERVMPSMLGTLRVDTRGGGGGPSGAATRSHRRRTGVVHDDDDDKDESANDEAAVSSGVAKPIQRISRAAAYLRLIPLMLSHCRPGTANNAFAIPDISDICKQYCTWDADTKVGATVGALFAMVVDSLQASGLNDISRAAIVAVRELLCSSPRWADELQGLVTQFQADIARTARGAGTAPPSEKAVEERAMFAFKAYAWSTVLGGCTLFVPHAGARVRFRAAHRHVSGSCHAQDGYLVDVPPAPTPVESSATNGYAATAFESARLAADEVALLPTSTTITPAMEHEEMGEDSFVGTTAAAAAARGANRGSGLRGEGGAASATTIVEPLLLSQGEVRVSRDTVFLPPLADTVGYAVPPYRLLSANYVVPAVHHFLRHLSDDDVRAMHNVEVAAVANFTHLAFNLVRDSPSSCESLLSSEALLDISRFANRAVVHHPLPLVFLKEFAAVALSDACDTLALRAAAAAAAASASVQEREDGWRGDGATDAARKAQLLPSTTTATTTTGAASHGGGGGSDGRGSDTTSPSPGPYQALGGLATAADTIPAERASRNGHVSDRNPANPASMDVAGTLWGDAHGIASVLLPSATHPPPSSPLRNATAPSTTTITTGSLGHHHGPNSVGAGPPAGGGRARLVEGGATTRDPTSLEGLLSRWGLPNLLPPARSTITAAAATTATTGGAAATADPSLRLHPPPFPPTRRPYSPRTVLCFCGSLSATNTTLGATPPAEKEAVAPAAVTILPTVRSGCPRPHGMQRESVLPTSLPLWDGGITLAMEVQFCSHTLHPLGEPYVIPPSFPGDDAVSARQSLHFSFFSLYVQLPMPGGAAGTAAKTHPHSSCCSGPFRLLHVYAEASQFVCRVSFPREHPASSATPTWTCCLPFEPSDWRRAGKMKLVVTLDDKGVVFAKADQSVALPLPSAVAADIAKVLSTPFDANAEAMASSGAVDRLIIGSHHSPPPGPRQSRPSEASPAINHEDHVFVFVFAMTMQSAAAAAAAAAAQQAASSLTNRGGDGEEPAPTDEVRDGSCHLTFSEGTGGVTRSADGAFTGELDGQVRWLAWNLPCPPDAAVPSSRINTGVAHDTPGAGYGCPPSTMPRAEVGAFLAALDKDTADRVGSEILWTLVARLARMVMATAMERCLSVDYKLSQKARQQYWYSESALTTTKDVTVPRQAFPFNPLLMFDAHAGHLARQVGNVFRFSDAPSGFPRGARCLRAFMQYLMKYLAHMAVAGDGATMQGSRRESPLTTFAREAKEAVLDFLAEEHEYFTVEMASANRGAGLPSTGTPPPDTVAPAMPLTSLNGGCFNLYFDHRSRVCESMAVFKDSGLRTPEEKVADNPSAWLVGDITKSGASAWTYVKPTLLNRPLGSAPPGPPSSQMALCGVRTRSLRPAVARAMFGAIAEALTTGMIGSESATEESNAVAALLSARDLDSLAQLLQLPNDFGLRTHALAVTTHVLDLWRRFPRIMPFDQAPLTFVFFNVNAAAQDLLRYCARVRHGDLNPASSYCLNQCYRQGILELLTSAIRLEEAWHGLPYQQRVRARWSRFVRQWKACTRVVPVVVAPAPLASSASSVPATGLRRLSLTSASTTPAQDPRRASASAVGAAPREAKVDGPSPPPPPTANVVAAAASAVTTGAASARASTHSLGLPTEEDADDMLPSIEMQPLWPASLRPRGGEVGRASISGGGGGGVGGTAGIVQVTGSGVWLVRCDHGRVTARSTVGFTRGRFYFEVTLPEVPANNPQARDLIIGLVTGSSRIGETGDPLGLDDESWGFDCAQNTRVHRGCRSELPVCPRLASGETVGVIMDITDGKVRLVYKGVQHHAFDIAPPATTATTTAAGEKERVVFFPAVTLTTGCVCEVNFGASAFVQHRRLGVLPASPQQLCCSYVTYLWSLLVAEEWGQACGAAQGIDHARGIEQMTPCGTVRPGTPAACVKPSLSTTFLHDRTSFAILQRRLHEHCAGRSGGVWRVDTFLSLAPGLLQHTGPNVLQPRDTPTLVRGAVAVRRGKWYYEVMVRRTKASAAATAEGGGTVTVGWAMADVDGDWSAGAVAPRHGGVTVMPGRALGDDDASWVLEGRRMIAKHGKRQVSLGRHTWQDGDVVGCLLDCDAGTMRFSINGHPLRELHGGSSSSSNGGGDGALFKHVNVPSDGAGLSPVIAADPKVAVMFLWSRDDLRYPPPELLAGEEEPVEAEQQHQQQQQQQRARSRDRTPPSSKSRKSAGRAVYRTLGAADVVRDALVEHFLGISTTTMGATRKQAVSTQQQPPPPPPVSLQMLQKVLHYISKSTDLNPHGMSAYCLYSPLTAKSRSASDSSPRVDGGSAHEGLLSDDAAAALWATGSSNNPAAAVATAALLGLSVPQLCAALEQLHVLSAVAEGLQLISVGTCLPCDVEQVPMGMSPGSLTDALLSLKHFCLPYVGLRPLHDAPPETEPTKAPPKLIVNRRRALAAMRDSAVLTPAQRLHDSLFGQVFSLLAGMDPQRFCTRKRLWVVTFLGEGAEDVGGPYRESLSQMCAELMSGDGFLPLFMPSPNQTADVGERRDALVINPLPGPHVLLDMYRFLGSVIGGCLRGGELLSLYLPSVVWKLFVGDLPDSNDLARTDHSSLTALEYIASFAVDDDHLATRDADDALAELCPDGFTTQDDANVLHELVYDGRSTPVKSHTARDYAALAMHYKLFLSTQPRLAALCEGFHRVIPLCMVSALTWYELEAIVCGQQDYDPDTLLDAARYEGLDPDDTRVLYLRQALKDFTRHQRSLFMRFVSGRERLPAGMRLKIIADKTGEDSSSSAVAANFAPQPPTDGSGASFVRQQTVRRVHGDGGGGGSGGAGAGLRLSPLALQTRGGSSNGDDGSGTAGPALSLADARLPHASTCFYYLSLPKYSSLAVMKERLLFAIEQCIDIDADFRVHDGDGTGEAGEPQLARVNSDDGDENFEDFSHLR